MSADEYDGTEADWIEDQPGPQMVSDIYMAGGRSFSRELPHTRDQGGDRAQPNRWRCLATGCNPRLDEATANIHRQETGHRVAKWPVRSPEGKRRARLRNKTGYYDKYNVGEKSYEARLGGLA